MSSTQTMIETMQYRLVLIDPESRGLYVIARDGGYHLPTVVIPQWTRPAEKIQRAVRETWRVPAIMLDYLTRGEASTVGITLEVLSAPEQSDLTLIPFSRLSPDVLSEPERATFERMLNGTDGSQPPFSQIGWVERAVAWCEGATNQKLVSKNQIAQYNAGGSFTLLQLPMDDGRNYWLKATGSPNRHEYDVTLLLSKVCEGFIPKVVASELRWNAWLMEDSGVPSAEPLTSSALAPAVSCLAGLQQKTLDCTDMLLSTGAFDQRTKVLQAHIDPIIEYLIVAMEQQTSTKSAPLSSSRLLEIGAILHNSCSRMDALGIPDTVLHNDLNHGNLLFRGPRCVLTDWSEAAIGNPFLSFERLCRLSTDDAAPMRAQHKDCWSTFLSESVFDEAYRLTPLLAIYACLYGRGDWLNHPEQDSPRRMSYRRSLARHMSRAANAPKFQETLCRA